MNTFQGAFFLRKNANAIEWRLLVFLILMLDVKLVLKLAAIAFAFFVQPDFKFGFRMKNPRLPLFYLSVIMIAVINFIFSRNYSLNYVMVTLTGILFWTASILAVHQLKLFVERTDSDILHNTLLVFFIINIAFAFINLSAILLEIGFRNPFLYQGQYQKYFINTGDYIKGVSFDTSTTNAVINCFGVIYFLYRKNFLLVIACMAVLLITASNFSNVILLLSFTGLFLFRSTKQQKSIMVICTVLLVIFFARLSPQNENYVTDTISKFIFKSKENIVPAEKNISIRETPDSLLTTETRKEKIAVLFLDSLERDHLKELAKAGIATTAMHIKKPLLPKDSIHTAAFQWKRDTTVFQRRLLSYMQTSTEGFAARYKKNTSGKIQSLNESVQFLQSHPAKIITGDGTGNFSSKLAFRSTGLLIAGTFPQQFIYCSPDFLNNHLSLYAYFFLKHADSHSIIHSPASVYDQLLTEYGLFGIIAFPVYYIGFFLRHLKKISYGLPLLLMMLAFFMVDYWFEQLSVVILFELMMFVNIKENTPNVANE